MIMRFGLAFYKFLFGVLGGKAWSSTPQVRSLGMAALNGLNATLSYKSERKFIRSLSSKLLNQ
jgi:hypothetical protein